jgi:hypothetical protein
MRTNKMAATLSLVVSPLLVAQQSAREAGSVRLPKDTAIHLKLDQDVSSATIHEGNRVRYIVTEDVVAGGVAVIPAGTAVFRRVSTVVSSSPGKSCGNENNGWFALSDVVLLPGSQARMKLTLLPPNAFPKEPKSAREKALMVAMAPLEIPVLAILAAAPIVLIPFGIASGIHDSLHRSPAAPAAPAVQTQPALPSSSPAATAPSAPSPCPAATHEEEWKASEAKVETYYLVHGQTVRAIPPSATSEPEASPEVNKEVQ